MNIGNITSNNFNLDNNGKDIQIEVYEQLIEQLQRENKQLKEIIKENTILVKDEYGDYQECNVNPLEMKQKYEKQVENWNKLKDHLENKIDEYSINLEYLSAERMTQIKNKMLELEQGCNSNE